MDNTRQHQLFDRITNLKIKIQNIASLFQNDFNICLYEGIYDSDRLKEMRENFIDDVTFVEDELTRIYDKGNKMLKEAIKEALISEGFVEL